MFCVLPKSTHSRPEVYREEDFRDDNLIPTIIFIEEYGKSEIIAGVWQIDHYELENGKTAQSPWDEIQKWKGSYNSWWRIWDMMPSDDDRKAAAWNRRCEADD